MTKFSALTVLLTIGLGLGHPNNMLGQQTKQQPGQVAARTHGVPRPTLMHTPNGAAAHMGRVSDQFRSKAHIVHSGSTYQRGTAPVNDECSGAILLTVGGSCVPTAGTVLDATQSIAPVECFDAFESSDDDVWYRFVATATTATILLECNPDFDGVIDLRSGACNGASIDCADGFIAGGDETINATGLTVGATYRFRVYDYGTGYPVDPTFNVCVFGTPAPPANDNCANATALMVNAAGACPGAAMAGDNTYATADNGDPACDVSTVGFLDVWYSFNSGNNTSIDVALTLGSITDIGIEVRAGSCAGTSVFCDFTSAAYNVPVTANTNYRIRVFTNTEFGAGGTFDICLSAPATGAPVNDLCDGAIVQSLAAPGSVTVTGDNTGATDTEGFGADQVWEAFTITECADVEVSLCGNSPEFATYFINLLVGCPTFTALVDTTSTTACVGGATLLFTGLDAGTYYYPVYQEDGVFEGAYTVTFTATPCGGGNTPVNDLCSSVTPVALATGGTVTFTGDNTDATITGDYAPGSDLDGSGLASVWHAFTTTQCANIEVSYCATLPAFQNVWIVLANSCPADVLTYYSSYNTTDCGSGNYTVYFVGLPAGTWYLPVMYDPSVTSPAVGPYSVDVTATPCAAPPANDDCAGSFPLDVNILCEPTTGTVFGATQSQAALLCNGFTGVANDDVWYSFVATGPNQTITVAGSDTLDAVVELLTGSCNSPATLACADATVSGEVEEIVVNNLVEGNTYYVRVYDYFQGYPVDPTFTICVTGDIGTSITEQGEVPFGISPNPGNGDVRLTYGGSAGSVTMELLDLTGRVVYSATRNLTSGHVVDLQLANVLSTGTYSLRLSSAEGQSVQRMMVR
jgi:hypothetical protein